MNMYPYHPSLSHPDAGPAPAMQEIHATGSTAGGRYDQVLRATLLAGNTTPAAAQPPAGRDPLPRRPMPQ